jgi:hypothetical protein
MRKIHLVGLAVFAVSAFLAVAASAAFAEEVPQYLVEGATIALGTSEAVTTETETGEAGLALIEDMNASAAGDPDILCEVAKVAGTILSNGEGETTAGECLKPVVDKGTCGSPKVNPVNLPWTSLLLEPTAGVFEVDLKAAGNGPGWAAECTVLGVKVIDTCTTQNGKALVTNIEGLLHIEFMEEIEKIEQANCSVGGAEQGLVNWLFFLHLFIGGLLVPLEVSLAAEVS